jgi:tetratricopeptide (TPR) repeat protein
MRPLAISILLCLALSLPAAALDEGHRHEAGEKLGTVTFPTSCRPAVQKSFERGVALLHSFAYDDAERQFLEVAKKDPACAMAHWGVAMSLYHPLWARPGSSYLERGAAEINKARTWKVRTERERAFIEALAVFYADHAGKDHLTRATAYSQAMEKVYQAYPKDHEAGAFYALSLLGAEPPNDTTFANRKKAIPILNQLFREEPEHPGLAHYIIHSCDKPQLAEMGLEAARRYARIAPSSPHALHMPSHIFARLGLWEEDIASNKASIEATRQGGAMPMGGSGHQFHAMDFLMYALVQSGRDREARAILDEAMRLVAESKSHAMHGDMAGYAEYAEAEFPAFFHLELRHWAEAAALEANPSAAPIHQAITYWARTIGSARMGDAEAARGNAGKYAELVAAIRSSKDAYLLEDEVAAGLEVQGWLAYAEKRFEDALRLLRQAADHQDAVGKGEMDLPAREMLADVLRELGRSKEALAEFETSLKTNPGRFNGLYGAARAAEAALQKDKAVEYYAQLLKNCEGGAHSDRPELERARSLVAQ